MTVLALVIVGIALIVVATDTAAMKVPAALAMAARRFWRELSPASRKALEGAAVIALAIASFGLMTSREWWVLFLAVFIYPLPTWTALERNHETVAGICALNLLLGWTVVGWVVAFIWALSRPPLPQA